VKRKAAPVALAPAAPVPNDTHNPFLREMDALTDSVLKWVYSPRGSRIAKVVGGMLGGAVGFALLCLWSWSATSQPAPYREPPKEKTLAEMRGERLQEKWEAERAHFWQDVQTVTEAQKIDQRKHPN
jgi:hypothetical protein